VTHRCGRDSKTVLLRLSLIGVIALAYFFHVTTVSTNPSGATNGLYDLIVIREFRAGLDRASVFSRVCRLCLVPTWLFSYSLSITAAHRQRREADSAKLLLATVRGGHAESGATLRRGRPCGRHE
jgi:hypothetical protein